ncbi:MAG TPA: ParM/StbA family protein [Thermodesulfobium narugense]|nr:ParM/StbA family protein [Thermodesulfobium narugense]
MKIGLDVGFGFTKVAAEDGTKFKFPSWIAYFNKLPNSEIEPIIVDGKEYVVGKDVVFMTQKVEIPDVNIMMNYLPIFIKYIEKELDETPTEIVTGVPPRYYTETTIKKVQSMGPIKVVPQGLGIFAKISNHIDHDEGTTVIVIDVGFNTVDYLIASRENGRWKKIGLDTIDELGVMQAVKSFREHLPADIMRAKNWTDSQLVDVFEKGLVKFGGSVINLEAYKKIAIENYIEMLKNRLMTSVGNYIFELDNLVLGGGGAHIIKNHLGRPVIVPDDPQYANAEGYLLL